MKQKISTEGIHAIKRFAILNFKPFRDPHGWVIGYNHRDSKRPGRRISPDMEITLDQAEDLFRQDIAESERYVRECITTKLKQGHFDALCMHVFFLPDRAVFPDCEVVRHINAGNLDEAGIALLLDLEMNHEHYEALARRSWFEIKMFAKDA